MQLVAFFNHRFSVRSENAFAAQKAGDNNSARNQVRNILECCPEQILVFDGEAAGFDFFAVGGDVCRVAFGGLGRVLPKDNTHQDHYQDNTDDTEQKVQFLTECAKLFASIENTIERDAYIQRLSDECLIERNAVYEQVQKYVNNNKTEEKKQYKREMQAISAKNDKIEAERAVNLRACNAEEALLSILLTNADASLNVCKTLTSDIFITPFNKKVYEKIKERAEKNLPTEAVDLSGDFSIDENSRISGFVYKHIKERDPFLAVKEYIEILEEESENQNFTPDRILMQDDEAIMEQIRKNMERKK